ncbi:hypothetical protein EWM62_00700 [Mucilaginibacter terrigena]|uniref:Protochlamydia outer membrane protein domain-containing protein n=1 Tax=Mucilaginibacter terrigena TaxID=2492395 RepID=A0A4Q5LR80_9SPHI|nr:hypothetical protein [Mucilaginibacter terrigena]RYU91992.1 hypothetical protein EWM62_00700 [Mucilaginibacter terrigena]
MRRSLLTCLAIITAAGLYAQTTPEKLSLSLVTGYERQDLKWSIAGNLAGENPNVYSELQWKKVGGLSVAAALEWNVWNRVLLTADYANVFIKSGTVSDNDYNGDNRTNMVYDELFNADKGYLRDWGAGGGYIIINKKNSA